MEVPANLKYTKEHEWVREEGAGVITIGITHFAQDALGDTDSTSFDDVSVPLSFPTGLAGLHAANRPKSMMILINFVILTKMFT